MSDAVLEAVQGFAAVLAMELGERDGAEILVSERAWDVMRHEAATRSRFVAHAAWSEPITIATVAGDVVIRRGRSVQQRLIEMHMERVRNEFEGLLSAFADLARSKK
jgi:hypothetical protein